MIALDGKSVRGARTSDGLMPHLVAALNHGSGTVLGHVAVTTKGNEIPAVRDLLASFDLSGVAVTIDAMHIQAITAAAICGVGGEYVLTVKKNQSSLCARPQEAALGCRARPHRRGQRPRPSTPAHDHDLRGPGLDHLSWPGSDRAAARHRHRHHSHERGNGLPHHLSPPPERATGRARRVGPATLGS